MMNSKNILISGILMWLPLAVGLTGCAESVTEQQREEAQIQSQVEEQGGSTLGVVNPNQAGQEELIALPHLDSGLVEGILERRPFLSMRDLNTFLSQSLGEEQLAELYVQLFVPMNLNRAAEEDFLLVPGLGPRLAHEFEEYRPYQAMAEFRREIGKYVDEQEVARLEQYVFVPLNFNTARDEKILTIPGVGPRLLHEFKEYRPYDSIEQFRREIGKYVSEEEVSRLERYVTL